MSVTTTGAPQLWRLEATGTAIRSLQWLEPDGELRGTAEVSADRTSASLWDMYLIPGRHWIAIETEGEDYTLTLAPLGPLAEGQEREPNEDIDHAEPLDIGVTRTARLPTTEDVDVVRFGQLQVVGEREPVEQLHHDVRPPVVIAEIEDRDDVPVRELPGNTRLAVEALAELGLFVEIRQHQLDGDFSIELLVDRREHDAHRAAADALDNAVLADRLGLRAAAGHRAGRHFSAS